MTEETNLNDATPELVENGIIPDREYIRKYYETVFDKKEDLLKEEKGHSLRSVVAIDVVIIAIAIWLGVSWSWTQYITIPLILLVGAVELFGALFAGIGMAFSALPVRDVVRRFEDMLKFQFDDDFRIFTMVGRDYEHQILLLSDSDCEKLRSHLAQTETELTRKDDDYYFFEDTNIKDGEVCGYRMTVTVNLQKKIVTFEYIVY